MSTELKPLLDLYATTVFLCPETVPYEQFAVVTACNPSGQILPENENKKLNILLKRQITQYDYIELVGASPDLLHQEASFAIHMPLSKAKQLAIEFHQNAIFWVQNNEVYIESAGLYFHQVAIGSFEQRCRKVST